MRTSGVKIRIVFIPNFDCDVCCGGIIRVCFWDVTTNFFIPTCRVLAGLGLGIFEEFELARVCLPRKKERELEKIKKIRVRVL